MITSKAVVATKRAGDEPYIRKFNIHKALLQSYLYG
jgi:hypothetical protein